MGRLGPQDEGDASRAVLDGGVNWIDTAPFYGWGRAEEVVGRALRGRADVLVFTKCGTMRSATGDDAMDLSPEGVRADVEAACAGSGSSGSTCCSCTATTRGCRSRRRGARCGLGVIVWAPLASGFLTDGFSLDALTADDFRHTHPFAELDLHVLHETLRRDGGTVVRGALRWVLAKPGRDWSHRRRPQRA